MSAQSEFVCGECRTPVSRNATSCPKCGMPFDFVRCPECSHIGYSQEFTRGCPQCGYNPHQNKLIHEKQKPGLPISFWLIGVGILTSSLIVLLYLLIG